MTTLLGPPEWPDAPPLSPPSDSAPPVAAGPTDTRSADRPGGALPARPPRSGSRRVRDGAGLVLVVLGAALLALGNAAVWVDETANDRETYAEASLLDLEDGGLAGLIRARLTSTLMSWADIPDRVDAALPGPLSLIGGPAEDLTQRVVDEAIAGTLALPEIEALIERIETTADDELMNLLFAESDWLRLDGDTVVLDLDPLVLEASYRIDEAIPDWASDAIPALSGETLLPDQIDGGGLELALGEVPVLIEARDTLETVGDLAQRYVVVGAVLIAAGLLLARRRGRVLVGLGLALATSAAIVGTGMPIDAVFAGDIGLLEEVAGASFVSIDGDALMARSLPLVGFGLALAAVAALTVHLWARRDLTPRTATTA